MNTFGLRPYSPVFRNVSGLLDDVFNRNLTDFFGSDDSLSMPSINILEESDSFKLEVAAPGMEKADFEVKTEDDMLTITAVKSSRDEERNDKYVRREFNYSSFKRSFQIPDLVDAENIAAHYDKGILTVLLPKREEEISKSPRTIEIS